MGCAPSKDNEKSQSNDGRTSANSVTSRTNSAKSVLREAVQSGRYSKMASYKPDPRCPLTERQLYSISKSWKAINREIAATAVNMFVRLLETDGIKSFFTKFKDHDTIAELRSSKVFEDHALMVISVIDEVISNLDDMDYVISLLESTGGSHSVRFKNFNPDFFWKVEEAFLWAVKETLNDRYTISMANIYTIVIRYIIQSIHDAFTKQRTGDSGTNNGGAIQQQQQQQQQPVEEEEPSARRPASNDDDKLIISDQTLTISISDEHDNKRKERQQKRNEYENANSGLDNKNEKHDNKRVGNPADNNKHGAPQNHKLAGK